jgi:hypothetical protein
VSVTDENTREELLTANNAPSLPNISVYACRRCLQCYWWSDRPNSSASRVMNAAAHLFSLALRAGVPCEGDLGIFDFINPVEEKKKGSTAALTFPRVEAFEWLKCSSLKSKFNLRSAYYCTDDGTTSESLPFTNVTRDFVNTLDYIFYEPSKCTQIGRLNVPTTFNKMNYKGIPNGHLLPSNIWPSDHLAIGSTFLFKSASRSVKSNPNSASINGSNGSLVQGSISSNYLTSPLNKSIQLSDQAIVDISTVKPSFESVSLRESIRSNASNKSVSRTSVSVETLSGNGSVGSNAGNSASDKGPVRRSASNSSSSGNVTSSSTFNPHKRNCKCGCVPKGVFSLFEMAEMRKQLRKQQKQAAESKNS